MHSKNKMESSSKIKCVDFDGKGDVKTFLTKVEIVASIKEYTDEKKAQFVASKLIGPAFDVYMRLSDDDKKLFPRIKEELLKEFEKGQLNREEAIHLLGDRRRQPEESPQTFAYKLIELVKLAYPDFQDTVRKTIAKDYFVRGVHPEMQIALKSAATFSTSDVNALAVETVRLELAGVKSYKKKSSPSDGGVSDVSSVNDSTINAIAEKVLEKLQINNTPSASGGSAAGGVENQPSTDVNYFSNSGGGWNRGRNRRGRGGNRGGNRGGYRGGNRGGNRDNGTGNPLRTCRGCQSTEHIVRNCPTRFCQACGNRGHDQNSEHCPNLRS